MKNIVWGFVLFFVFSGIFSVDAKDNSRLLVKFHADWCPKCNAWDKAKPGFYQLQDEAVKQGIRVIVLDFTNKTRTKKSEQLAEKEGITKFYDQYAPGTGFALLIDPDRKKSVTISPIRHDYKTQVELLN